MIFDTNNLLISSSSPNTNNLSILVDYNLTQITPFVYVSSEETVRQCQPIFSNDINCIINVACELPHVLFPPSCGIESIKYSIEDLPDFPIICYFNTIADRIADNVALNRRTLVYCRHGRSRSIAFILAYLIKYHHLPLSTAFTLVQEQRPLASPNIGFWTQLKLYELYLKEKNSQSSKTLNYIQNSLQNIFDGIKQFFYRKINY
jgi:hypothetical protein